MILPLVIISGSSQNEIYVQNRLPLAPLIILRPLAFVIHGYMLYG